MTDAVRRQFERELMKFKEALDGLKRHRATDTLETFRAQPDAYHAVCFLFVIALESLVDIGQYILASRGKRAESQRDVPMLLARERLIPEDLAGRLQDALNFRNRLIHAYPNMDDEKVALYLRENLGDFDAFLAAVDRALDG